jgi:hypothetical protein
VVAAISSVKQQLMEETEKELEMQQVPRDERSS